MRMALKAKEIETKSLSLRLVALRLAGKWMFGILNKGDDNAITVNGDVITTGSSARAINSQGNRNTITLNGNITTGVKGKAPNSSSPIDAIGIETSGG